MLGENIEDQRRPVEHSYLEHLFEIARLGGAQFIVKDHQPAPSCSRRAATSLTLPGPMKNLG